MCWIICHIKRQLFSHKMTPILFLNIKWLFVRFIFCHRTTVTLDTQWQNARTFLERINLRYTTEHDSKLSRYRIRNNWCSTVDHAYCVVLASVFLTFENYSAWYTIQKCALFRLKRLSATFRLSSATAWSLWSKWILLKAQWAHIKSN